MPHEVGPGLFEEIERLRKERDYFRASYSRKLDDEARALDAAIAAEAQREALAGALRDIEFKATVQRNPLIRDAARAALASLPQPPSGEPPTQQALENVRALAARAKARGAMRYEEIDHLLRFCAEGGVVGSILRDSSGEPRAAPLESPAQTKKEDVNEKA